MATAFSISVRPVAEGGLDTGLSGRLGGERNALGSIDCNRWLKEPTLRHAAGGKDIES